MHRIDEVLYDTPEINKTMYVNYTGFKIFKDFFIKGEFSSFSRYKSGILHTLETLTRLKVRLSPADQD